MSNSTQTIADRAYVAICLTRSERIISRWLRSCTEIVLVQCRRYFLVNWSDEFSFHGHMQRCEPHFTGLNGSHLNVCTVCGALRVYALWDKDFLLSILTLALRSVQIVIEFVGQESYSS